MPKRNHHNSRRTFFLIIAATIAASALRLPKLSQRPMHGDEAVHAIKFGALLENGDYRYDRFEYHGPTLNYLTLIPAWLRSERTLLAVDEWTLRLVPVCFGTLLVLMTALLWRGLGKAAIIAAILTAISPAMVYYSRYYIQEMLLVGFTFGVIVCGYRYTQNPNFRWAVATGFFFGLMHATKETCIIAWGAMLLALILALARHGFVAKWRALKRRHLIAAFAAAVVVSILFFSSFFTNWHGVLDAILTYKSYLSRAGQNPVHIHPWSYYLNLLVYFRIGENPVWSEALILLLAGVGLVQAMKPPSGEDVDCLFIRFLAFYTLFMTLIYSLIPYKTPWNLISFLHGMILLAGVGAAAISNRLSNRAARLAIMALLSIGGAHLTWQAYSANFKYYENPANPYVYAHPGNDVFTIVKRVEEIAQAQPEGRELYLQVICPGDDYWPLPWYWRAFPNIGWWNQLAEEIPAAPLIIASPAIEPALLRKLYELPPPGQRPLYLPLFDAYTELRPGMELRGYVRKDLWDLYQMRNP